jgi:hypothetical protein
LRPLWMPALLSLSSTTLTFTSFTGPSLSRRASPTSLWLRAARSRVVMLSLMTMSPSSTPGRVRLAIHLLLRVFSNVSFFVAMTKLPKSKARAVGVSNHTIPHVGFPIIRKTTKTYTNFHLARGHY